MPHPIPFTRFRSRFLLPGAALAILLAGCGGSSGPTVDDTPAGRGALLRNSPTRLLSLDVAGVGTQLNKFGPQLLAIAGAPKCGIDFHRVEYNTVGAAGEATTASAALLVPTGADPACGGQRPLVLYGHGSSFQRKLNMADIGDMTNEGAGRISTPAAMYAAQGYIVIAPNYAGYDTSALNYHPHHIAEQQSKDMIDALAAARTAMARLTEPVAGNGKLFLTGYSEGGYAAMATHRAMQAAGVTVTASAPQSGSYAESIDYEALGTPGAFDEPGAFSLSSQFQLVLQITAWQKAYGNLYATPSEVYSSAHASAMETLLPTNVALHTLVPEGKFPAYFLSTEMANYAGLSAAQKGAFGTPANSLMNAGYLGRVLADIAANPCPVTSPLAPLACSPANPMRAAWLKNDLRTWTPAAPMLMCGGKGDPEVNFAHARLTHAYFQAHGSTAQLLDVDSPVTANDPYARPKTLFAAIRQALIDSGDDPATVDNYHGFMANVACEVAARDFFSRF
ncbi:prolyl oligopeptidase family serine peptidase [Massilia sp. CCM 8734]|uniref:alpha/beta hydrolase family protein n=1 Tax=Massilia sp. CCM 8734 TaxID=2609283 RepID=UPI001423310C|nr:prolyl oligopeptidase family serine peptidase [Massilia sp. CCM 8734]NHZ99239.1 prolyl oligopeptidase family serine peptidase [Massilia sp. CCM 8734]